MSPQETPDVFQHVLISTYFLYDSKFYGQRNNVVMGSPMPPVIASSYMEKFEKTALDPVGTKIN